MKVKAKDSKDLEDGSHKGILARYEIKDGKDGEYLAWIISEIDGDKDHKRTFFTSMNLSEKSVLGVLIQNVLNVDVVPDQDYDLDQLLNIKVVFQSITKRGNEFPEILRETIKKA